MTLQAFYATYLRRGASREAANELAAAMAARFSFEAEALRSFAAQGAGWFEPTSSLPVFSRPAAQPVYVGPSTPDAPPGALWFDTVELSAMVLLKAYIWPDERDELSPEAIEDAARQNVWCSLRPVSRFQFGAFRRRRADRTCKLRG